MGKHEFLTPKAIANRIKAKGLQKLKWYCQMCEKQCRDENGFKCHCASESHQRQMQIFGHNPGKFMCNFSRDFEDAFMELMRRSHRSSRVAANVVYNEYIADRNAVHMNSTRWATLTDFIKYLGRAGKLKVEDTPKGWFISYIDHDPEAMIKDGMKKKRVRSEMAEEERHEKRIEAQIDRAKNATTGSETVAEAVTLQREEKIAFSFGGSKLGKVSTNAGSVSIGNASTGAVSPPEVLEEVKLAKLPSFGFKKETPKRGGVSAIEQLKEEQERAKERKNRKDYWLCEGIIVKVMSRDLADYYKLKGVVKSVHNKYVGEIQMLESGHILKVDQEELETVIPQLGGLVRIVNGAYRDSKARLASIDEANFTAKVKIERGPYDGMEVSHLAYEDICKLAT